METFNYNDIVLFINEKNRTYMPLLFEGWLAVSKVLESFGYAQSEVDYNGWEADLFLDFTKDDDVISLTGSFALGELSLNRYE